jgi:hypothetical protein
MAVGYNPRIVTDGLVLALDAANTKSYGGSGTTWTDLNGRGNNGTISGATYNSDGYFSFDSTDDLVTIPNSSDLTFGTGEFAVEIWWNRTTTGSCKAWALGDLYYTNGIELTYSATNGLIVFSGIGGIRITADSVPSSNAWHHYVVERTGSTWKLYIDGVVQSETYSSSASLGTGGDGDMRLGAQKYNGSLYYNGTKNISNFKVYKGKGLTAAEVKQNFNALRGRFGI